MEIDIRRFALGEEVLTSVRLIERGLAELQRIDGANDFYHAALLLLSGGLERLMKCILCFRAQVVNGALPSTVEIKKYGHDLERLLETVVGACFDEHYRSSRPAADADAIYLQSDSRLRRLLGALSRFARSARYYNLNVVGGDDPDTDSPEQEWKKLELEIMQERSELMKALTSHGGYGDAFDEIGRELVSRLERVVRALCRLFTLGPLGSEAKACTGYIDPFLFLMDEDLGKRDYRGRDAARF